MKRLLVLVAALILSACETAPDKTSLLDTMYGESVSTVTLPDGRTAYIVNCDARGIAYCYERSRAICKGGNYTVTNRIDRPGEVEDIRRLEIVCSA